MARYIDAEKIELSWYIPDVGYLTDCQKEHNRKADFAQELLDNAPTEDVAPVIHAHWCVTDAYPHNVYCSKCLIIFAQTHWPVWEDNSLPRAYCPTCGAKMDEEA